MKRGWFILLALSVGLNAGLLYVTFSTQRISPIHHGYPDHPPPRESGHIRQITPKSRYDLIRGRIDHLSRVLELDSSQQEHMGIYLKRILPVAFEQREVVTSLQKSLPLRITDPDIDSTQIRTLLRELNMEQARLDSLVAETMLGELALLTPEQRHIYATVMPRAKPVEPPPEP